MTNQSRRTIGVIAVVIALIAALVACGSGDDSTDGSSQVTPEAGALPVTLNHKFGQTTVTKAPSRVVSLGYSDQDALLALGITPIAVRNWEGMAPEGEPAGPWAIDKVTGDKPKIITSDTVSFEEVAALKPDLIVAVYSDVDKSLYDQLSKVAPVLVQKGEFDDYQQPWDVTTEEIGKAVGKPEAAKALVAGVKGRIADLAARHQNWKGKTVSIATYDGTDLAAFAGADPRVAFFKALGFAPNQAVDAAAGDKFYAKLSIEEARKLDTDVIVWDQLSYAPKGKATITEQSTLANLPAVRDGRSVFLEGELEKAFGWQTVLSLGFVVDNIEQPLVAATS
ncbi:iron-siderophore ABC transporter substrate-binding protein [Gordonia sp. PDNC005]|uniref:iron-siderophore ABC transporter substrate-binding protein n=1 Tax=unclassified Gordonia (in: high G+C Gram-positive bacteria) TaxID=2657482 RepID=UPI001964F464|nr:iron-siderophore ABC transporter substrate-binding protein [Gordonia sp. PDNC005]QRY63049.1 iron-siderophore ABC transporter substrate-binding protein [Gordonia sp. PDNC005]